MAKPDGTVEMNVFVSPELRDAVQRKCRALGTNASFIVRQFLEDWSKDAPPPISSSGRLKRKQG